MRRVRHDGIIGAWILTTRGDQVAKRLAMGELESAVMDVVWDAGGWMTPGEVHEVLSVGHELAYTTVMTILVRLWRKVRLERTRDGRAFAYRAVESREQHAATRMRDLLAATCDRPVALSHFVGSLSARDKTQLRRMLGDEKRR